MRDGSHGAFIQHQEARGFEAWGGTQEQRARHPSAAEHRDPVADACRRFQALDLDGLRTLYEETVLAARSARKQEDFMAHRLTATLIRREIRSRGTSPHETLFITVPAPIDPIARK